MGNDGILGAFAGHAVLAKLSDRHKLLLASGARAYVAAAGEFLARQEDASHTFYLIKRGQVAISVRTPKGPVEATTVGPGEVVGWSWLIPPHRWQFDCRAVEPVEAVAFDAEWLREKCEQDSSLGYHLLQGLVAVLSSRLAATREQLVQARK
jgi:CRP-like cAMP-binding protein